MSIIQGTWKNGQVMLDRPANWPDGCRLAVEPVHEGRVGVSEEDWDNTPEGIAAWIQWYDSVEPLEMTAEEEAKWEADLEAQKQLDKAAFNGHARRLERLFT